MEFTVRQIAEVLEGTVEGNPDAVITSPARIESGKPGAIWFYANPKYEKYVYECEATAIIVNKDFVPQAEVKATLIRVDNAYESIARLLDYVSSQKKAYRSHRGWHSRVRFSAKLGKKVYVGDFSYVGRHAVVGDCTKIYEQVYIGDDVQIGHHCIIYPGVKIYPGMVIGNNVILHSGVVIGADGFGFAPTADGSYKKIEHTGNVIIEEDVEIGANSCVDKSQMGATIIRKGVKIDNLVQVAHNVEVGENTVLCAMVGIAGSSKIGKQCVLAGQAGVAGHLTLADHTTLGAQTGVISSVKKEGAVLFGTPAIDHKEFMRSYVMFRRNGKDGLIKK